MNEQIKLLAEQAELNVTLLFNNKKLENFTELLVKVCVKHIEEERFKLAESLDTEYDDGYVDGMYRAEHKLREHFGIKK